MIDGNELERRKKLLEQAVWEIPDNIDVSDFDLSWRPSQYDRPYIHEFGTQWQPNGGPRLVIPENEGIKYQTCQRATAIPMLKKFTIVGDNIVEFDWSWHPDNTEPDFIWVFGNQHYSAETMPTVEYHVGNATERKYVHDTVAKLLSSIGNWKVIVDNIMPMDFARAWSPHPYDPPYIYVWGNKWNDAATEPTIEYHVPGATERKYMPEPISLKPKMERWNKILPVDDFGFDFTWRPNPYEPPYIYVWGNKWNDAATEPTIEYHVDGATERKYMTDRVADVVADMSKWTVFEQDDIFDFTWRPNPYSEPQIYQWENNGPRYSDSDATKIVLMARTEQNIVYKVPRYVIETTLEELIEQHHDEVFWALNKQLSYDGFDFGWKPDNSNFRHINVFGNELSKDVSTYYINGPAYMLGHRDKNYVEDKLVVSDTKLSMFWVDTGSNKNSIDKFNKLSERYPQIQKTRFQNSWVDTINRCIKKASTDLVWVLSSELNYDNFEFDFYPSTWQINLHHVFGTQWSHWGNTYLVNSNTFPKDSINIKLLEHMSNINHVRNRRALIEECRYDILYIDHGNENSSSIESFGELGKNVYQVKFCNSYLQTINKWLDDNISLKIKTNYYVWVVSSICDYGKFDFTWYSDPFQNNQIHVFASEFKRQVQKFGDTLLLNVSEFVNNSNNLDKLENYHDKINYVSYNRVPRLPHPVIKHSYDSQVDAIQSLSSLSNKWPYYELIDVENIKDVVDSELISLWEPEHQSIQIESTGASHIMVPSISIDVIKDEVYDYPYVKTSSKTSKSNQIDVVFISNGEPNADENYEHLLMQVQCSDNPNRIVRVDNVNGRVESQHAAAHASNTNWYFLVNAKLKVDEHFDWSWQPDRLQKPKHYIFNAKNIVNELCYGHMAIVANNKKLTLSTKKVGLDFTLDGLHQTVDINSGVAIYNTDSWTTWRTAFRECIKLSVNVKNNDRISKERLDKWQTGSGVNMEWSIKGACDAIEYFHQVEGDHDKLMLSYDWQWLREKFENQSHN